MRIDTHVHAWTLGEPSFVDNGEAQVIPNAEGSRTTPSVVSFAKDGERRVGSVAKRQGVTNPENTVFAIKRLMGLEFGAEPAQKHAKMVPYQVVGGPSNPASSSMQRL